MSNAQPPTRPSQTLAVKKHGGDKREAITAAALELFVERGFYGTAVPEIADLAGVGAGTIYRYFESKEALVNAIYREQKAVFSARRDRPFPVDCAHPRAVPLAVDADGQVRGRDTRSRSSSSSCTITRATSTTRVARWSSGCSICSPPS